MRSGIALGLVAVLALGTALPVRAQEDYSYDEGQDAEQGGYYDEGGDDQGYEEGQAPEPEDYDDALNPYGSWLDDPTYGRVWRPEVAGDWRPYVEGYWAWTSDGWTWVSSEPWAWTFHYGRWAPLRVGWAWVPGFEWGPAWVSWFWDDGFVGWAPLAPFGVSVGINNFVFVHERFFCNPHLTSVIFDHHRLPDRVVHDWGRQHFHAPAFDRIQRVADHPVRRFEHRPPQTLAPWRRHAVSRLHRPGGVPENGRHGFAPAPRRLDHSARRFDRPARRHDQASFGVRPPLPHGRFDHAAPGRTRAPHLERPRGPRAERPNGFHVTRPPALPRGDHFAGPPRAPQTHLARPQSWRQPRWGRPPELRRPEPRRQVARPAFQPRPGWTHRQFASAPPRQAHVARPQSWSQPRAVRPPELRRPEVRRQVAPPAFRPSRVQPRAFAGTVPGRSARPAMERHALRSYRSGHR